MKKLEMKNIQWICIVILTFVLMLLVAVTQNLDKRRADEIGKKAEAEYDKRKIEVNDNKCVTEENEEFISASSIEVGKAEGHVIINPTEFKNNVLLSSEYAYLKTSGLNCSENDIVICQFEAYTKGESASLKVEYGDFTNVIYLTKTPTTYYIPMVGLNNADKIRFDITSDYVKTVIDKFYLINYFENYTIDKLKTGYYGSYENTEDIASASSSLTGRSSVQCLVKDNYMFSIDNADGNLYSFVKNEDGSYSEIGKISHLGATRDMQFDKTKNALIITARQNGMYTVDITNPAQMSVLAHYDTLEATTGVYVYGDYAFLCSRYCGVEIVNIADLRKPYLVNKISDDSEYQDCFVEGQYLYVGVYKEKRIDIYDISDLGNVKRISKINLDGSGQGCFVKKGILYVSTGLNSSNVSEDKNDFGAGTGNGMEIYDVSEPEFPELLSIVKIDGRYNFSGRDIWDIQVSDNYAFLTSMYNGCYVYDVSDLSAPKLVKRYILSTPIKDNIEEEKIYSWNVTESGRGAANHVFLGDGELYVSMTDEGVYRVDCEFAKRISDEEKVVLFKEGTNANINVTMNDENVKIYNTNSSIWSCVSNGEYIYVAAGMNGIQVLDKEMNLVNTVSTKDSCRDIKLYGEYLYTAESTAGVAVYKVDGSNVTKYSENNFEESNYFISQIELTGDYNYIIAQASNYEHIVINIKNKKRLRQVATTYTDKGSLYYRNICTGLVAGKYVGIFGSEKIGWYSSENEELVENTLLENVFYREKGGMCAIGDKCVAILSGGYMYFDIFTNESSDVIKAKGASLEGKVSSNGKYMVVSNTVEGNVVILDVSDINNPILVSEYEVGKGNPDIAYVSNDMILIPLRYGGLMQVKPA